MVTRRCGFFPPNAQHLGVALWSLSISSLHPSFGFGFASLPSPAFPCVVCVVCCQLVPLVLNQHICAESTLSTPSTTLFVPSSLVSSVHSGYFKLSSCQSTQRDKYNLDLNEMWSSVLFGFEASTSLPASLPGVWVSRLQSTSRTSRDSVWLASILAACLLPLPP